MNSNFKTVFSQLNSTLYSQGLIHIWVISTSHTNLFIKEGCLFVYHVEIFQTTTPSAMHLVSLESFQWVSLHQGHFVMFRTIFDNFFIDDSKRQNLKLFEIVALFVDVWKCLLSKILWRWLSNFWDLRCKRHWILSYLCHCKFNKNSTKSELNILEFKLGQMVHATLVLLEQIIFSKS
jgi:hypothetical protein